MEPFSIQTLVMCFAGGIVGGALGGLFSFIICGLMVMAGCLVIMASGSDFILLQVGLGPIFGPHVGGFASGVAAATYAAAVKKNHPGGAAKGHSFLSDGNFVGRTSGGRIHSYRRTSPAATFRPHPGG